MIIVIDLVSNHCLILNNNPEHWCERNSRQPTICITSITSTKYNSCILIHSFLMNKSPKVMLYDHKVYRRCS